jgi:NTE family protein
MVAINRPSSGAPTNGKSGIALSLSGGGYRSALFHLGALRRLNELGVLSRVDTFTSVSGGSIIAAYLLDRMQPWPNAGGVFQEWDQKVGIPFKNLASSNIRTWPLLKRWIRPWKWLNSGAAIASLAKRFEKDITATSFSKLPAHPRFVFCATDMVFGVSWVFEKARLGDDQAGYVSPAPDWPIAQAVAASACFPPVFGPMPMQVVTPFLQGGIYQGQDRQKLLSGLRLTDGGVHDNLALEPAWEDHQIVMVSDGGAPFGLDGSTNYFRQFKRYLELTNSQSTALRKRWLLSRFENNSLQGAYWGIRSAAAKYPNAATGYPENLAEEVISTIRTDFDAFSEAEIKVLENHGYLTAEAAIQGHLRNLIPLNPARLEIPHPEFMDEDRVHHSLRSSSKRALLGRGWPVNIRR